MMLRGLVANLNHLNLLDGENIRLSDRTFNVIHVPGHTPWCILLYNIEKGLAFAGDFLLKDISSNALIQKPSYVPEGYKSLKCYISSLKRVRDLGVEVALPGHGEIIVNPLERVDELLSFIESRKEDVLSVIRRGAKTVFQIVEVLFPSLPHNQLWLAVSEVIGYIELLEDEGFIENRKRGFIYVS